MSKEETVKDSKGREIVFREIKGSEQAKIMRLAGDAWGANAWAMNTFLRARVVSIDGKAVASTMIRSVADLDGLWDQVDNDAAQAVADAVVDEEKNNITEAKNSVAPQA